MPGPLMGLALAHLNLAPNRPDALAPRKGLPDRERVRLQRFITCPGLKITTSHGQREPGRQGPRPRVVRRLSKDGAADLTFELDNGQQTTVADYFRAVLGKPLRHPDVICVEVCNDTMSAHFVRLTQNPAARDRCSDPTGALSRPSRTDHAKTGTS